jgi:hypothetical protein
MSRLTIFTLGLVATVTATWVWHGPLGHGETFAAGVERRARAMLDHYEMTHVQARLERGPLTRRVILSGPADDFQRREIKRMVEAQPGVSEAAWSASSVQTESTR